MGEREGGESRSMGAFLLGFLLGVLLTLGAGGTFLMVGQRGEMLRARESMAMAEAARAEAELARDMAEKARQAEERARKAEQEARKGAEKKGEKGVEAADQEAEKREALARLRTLDLAVKAHMVTNRAYPNTLEELTVPVGNRPAALEKVSLMDPWGRAYIYERGKTNPRTGVPLIYSLGPDPKDEKGRIRNW